MTSSATQKAKSPEKLEIKSDEIEFALYFNMLVVFSASPLVLSVPCFQVLLPSPHVVAQFVHHSQK